MNLTPEFHHRNGNQLMNKVTMETEDNQTTELNQKDSRYFTSHKNKPQYNEFNI